MCDVGQWCSSNRSQAPEAWLLPLWILSGKGGGRSRPPMCRRCRVSFFIIIGIDNDQCSLTCLELGCLFDYRFRASWSLGESACSCLTNTLRRHRGQRIIYLSGFTLVKVAGGSDCASTAIRTHTADPSFRFLSLCAISLPTVPKLSHHVSRAAPSIIPIRQRTTSQERGQVVNHSRAFAAHDPHQPQLPLSADPCRMHLHTQPRVILPWLLVKVDIGHPGLELLQ